ncbi:MAG: 2Fe-2S iron-sulfur cluster binding domain-containing protein [Methylococcales bacterium]|jgi:uncharacterized protein|nr:2Fe-2S iron-sulfur cluster binding domain-containing protein [Methylococcales bacterium]MBT7445429.1 2Fe-2S iron-sulfur cluster binding domain-containing protein [Methylococcales bacterium]
MSDFNLHDLLDLVIEFSSIAILGAIGLYVVLVALKQFVSMFQMTSRQDAYQARLKSQVELIRIEANKSQSIADNSWQGTRKFIVKGKVLEADHQCSMYLVPHDGKPLPSFHPGQYLTFMFPVPGKKKPITRCYSLSDSPNPDYYRVTVKRLEPPMDRETKAPMDVPAGLGSSYFHQSVKVGDVIDVKCPSGHFWMETKEDFPVVLIGGGIGLTPVLSMVNQIIESGSKRETWFFYGLRSGSEHCQKKYLERIAAEHDHIHMHICYSRPDADDVMGEDYHHKARVSVELFKELLPSSNYDYYMCGPGPMMNSIVSDLEEWGVPKKQIHFEAFGPASVKPKAAPAAGGEKSEKSASFDIEFARSEKKLAWDPDAASLLEFAEENDIELESGCRAGNCGTCKQAVKSGDVEYLQEPGAPVDDGYCLMCVSVPKTNMVIDA